MHTLVIAEKPSVARDLARVLGCREKGEAWYQGGEWRVSWALGHLVSLCEPEEIDEKWKRWRAEDLPILPETLPLKVLPKTKKQYNVLKKLMADKECAGIVCATDAGREGELIFRNIYQMAACKKPVRRLWISSMTDESIRDGFAAMKPMADYDALYRSARCRSEADWLVGMNASRAFTLRYGVLLSIGRVQTPTLALLVRRRREIEAFTPKDYWTLTASFGDYEGQWLNEQTKEKKLTDGAQAEAIAAKVKGKPARVERILRETKRELSPRLYDLTSLQRDANRLLGFTAKKTLDVAQKLYEERKLLTYPRTDSRCLTPDMTGKTKQAIERLPEKYGALKAPLLSKPLPVSKRVFDASKVSDHHALITTGRPFDPEKLPPDERNLLDLVIRRMLAVFYPEFIYDRTQVWTRCEGELFESVGREIRQKGWRETLAGLRDKAEEKAEKEEPPLPPLSEGDARKCEKTRVKADKTKPPAPHTDASLLNAMEHAGRDIEDDDLRESMKDSGLGTPATRAAILERLLQVGYAERKGRALNATDKGVRLIEAVPDDIASAETTGRWEKALAGIAEDQMDPARFLEGIRRLSASLVESAKKAPDVPFEPEERRARRGGAARKAVPSLGKCPLCGKGDVLENSKAFYCSRWKDGCALKIWKDCVARAGGPELNEKLIRLLLKTPELRGSTGVLRLSGGSVSFEPRRA